jgi:2-keto-3-deoxy-L-rhamnonate aldolase RhmA
MADWREGLRRGDLRHPGLRARIRGGERLLGTFVKSRDPLISEALAVAGYDFLVADLEHSTLSVAEVDAAGAARAAVHYPPLGERSLSLSTRAARFGAVPAALHVPASLEQTVLIGQIESAEGLAALPEIVESGVFDALFLGPTDLSASLGHPGQVGHPDVAAALADTAAAIISSGTPLGIFCATADEARQWAERGLTLLAISTDLTMLSGAADSVLGQLRTRG